MRNGILSQLCLAGTQASQILAGCQLITPKTAFKFLSGPHIGKLWSMWFRSLPKSLYGKSRVFTVPGILFSLQRGGICDPHTSHPHASWCLLSLYLAVSKDAWNSSLSEPKFSTLFKGTMFSGVHFLLQAPGGNLAAHLGPLRSASALGKAIQLVDVYTQTSDEGQIDGSRFPQQYLHQGHRTQKTGETTYESRNLLLTGDGGGVGRTLTRFQCPMPLH